MPTTTKTCAGLDSEEGRISSAIMRAEKRMGLGGAGKGPSSDMGSGAGKDIARAS
jgi:hypothetical protein